ncbi:ABC transporter permease [Pontivivens ytuae]|uniref:ABC transporter permease n=1 Tax=Pontivivens ytuae TaxID=2789856 RepID=A0A7S9LNW6_9RHOB|nr:ABC transporter permease [Pontivivens ytuae]QPH52376.1 ABC transporter permease [Pontivivens ytuae]
MRSLIPILTILAAIVAIWYAGAVALNADWARQQAERQERVLTFSELVAETWSQDRPRLPAPHQVAVELWDTTVEQRITSRRSLIHHGWITLSVTLAGFAFGAALGIALAIGIVYNRAMDMSVMPWVIASQTIPILAIAPMIIVVLNSVGMQGFIPKAIIATYLSFFPVTVGMVKGLRAPTQMQLDQMKTWNASGLQGFLRLRLPSSMPYLFTSLKIAIAASLVGTIVGELPTGAVAGLGARLLAGSYYGQTVQIWSALFAAAALAAVLILAVGAVEKFTMRRMGFTR